MPQKELELARTASLVVSSDRSASRLQRVLANVRRMDALVTDLLTFSRMSRVPVSKRTIAPGQMVQDIVDELAAEHGGRRFEVRVGTLPLGNTRS